MAQNLFACLKVQYNFNSSYNTGFKEKYVSFFFFSLWLIFMLSEKAFSSADLHMHFVRLRIPMLLQETSLGCGIF